MKLNIILLYALLAFAFINIDISEAAPQRADYLKLIENQGACFGDEKCYSIYKIIDADGKQFSKKNNFDVYFTDKNAKVINKEKVKLKTSKELKTYEVEYFTNDSFQLRHDNISYIPYNVTYETSVFNNITLLNETKNITETRYNSKNTPYFTTEYALNLISNNEDFRNALDTKQGGTTPIEYFVKISGTLPLNSAVDNVISYAGYNFTEFAWWNSSWNYVAPINASGNSSEMVDYQVNVKINTTTNPNMNWSNNGSDIRFTYNDNTISLSYWIESWNNATSPNNASIWVKTNQSIVNMWYGNPTATSQSNISATMLFGDDVTYDKSSSYNKNGSVWTYNSSGNYKINGTTGCSSATCFIPIYDSGNLSQNYTIYAEITVPVSNANTQIGFIHNAQNNRSTTSTYNDRLSDGDGFVQIYKWNPVAQVGSNSAPLKMNWNTKYSFSLDVKTDGSMNYTVYNSTNSYNVTTKDTTWTTGWAGLSVYLNNNAANYLYLHKLYIRKKANAEPTLSIGAEQTQKFQVNIFSPSTQTYYITNHTLNFTVIGVNTTYPCWKTLDGVITSLGNIANNTANASTITLNNSAHSVSVTCYGGAPSQNTTTTVTPTVIYSELRAKNAIGGAPINTFTAVFGNGTTNTTLFTTTGLIQTPLDALPQGAVNLTLTADGFGMNNTINYTINSTNFFNTSVNMNAAALIIYTFDEKTLSALTFNVTFANSTTSKTWYNVNNISQLYSNLTLGDSTITISSVGYQTRKYYKTITSTMYETLNAYLLSTASGMTVRFHVVSIADQPIQTVVSTAQLSIGGTLTIVEQTTTDSSGTASLFLDPTVTYSISFTHPSYTSNYLSINPTQQDYKITMTGTSTYINNTFQYGDVTVRLTPTGTSLLRHSPGNTTLNYSVSAPSGDLTDWGWFVKWNGTTLYTNAYTSVSGGSDSYFVNTTNLTGLLYVDMFYTKLGTTTWMTNIYTMNNITLGNNTIADIFSRFGTDNYGFQKTNMLFIGFVAIIFMMGYVSQYSVAGAGVVGWLGLVVLSYAGLIATGILVICGIAVLSILIIRGGFN